MIKRILSWTFFLAALGGLGWGGYATYASMGAPADAPRSLDRFHPVTRGDFNVTILLDGTLDAIRHYDIRVESRRYDRIISWAVEDKAKVKKGDVLVELAQDKHEDEVARLKLELENVRKELELAYEDVRIRQTESLSSVKSSDDALREAKEALARYRDLDAPKQRKDLQDGVVSATAAVKEAEKALADAKQARFETESQSAAKITELDTAITTAQTALEEKETALKTAKHDYRIFRQFDFPKTLRAKRDALLKAGLDNQKSLIGAEANDIKNDRNILNIRKRLETLERDLRGIEEDMELLTLRAPVDGIVTLGNRHIKSWQQPKEIKIGTSLAQNENVAYIPDLSRFEVKLSLPEEFRSQVKLKQLATFRNPAIPNLVMEGEVEEISVMPHRLVDWDKSSPNVYDIRIRTEALDPRLMPGMSVDIELVIEKVADVLFVPVEAVYAREGKTYCKIHSVLGGEEREVSTGRHSLSFVEIASGLKEGEEVLLSRSQDVSK